MFGSRFGLRVLPVGLYLVLCTNLHAQSIFTIAGGGTDDGRPATVASLQDPLGVAVNRAGNIYVAVQASHRIRRIHRTTGIITTIAGTGSPGLAGDGGLSTAAALASPSGLAIDDSDNLYIADTANHRIRKITAETGTISTVAGGGEEFPGDGKPATQASISFPAAVALDGSGSLYIAEHSVIRRVDARSGIITTVAGTGFEGFSGDGGPATKARLRSPRGMAFDRSGNLYIADSANGRIRRVTAATGIIATVAGNGEPGFSGDGADAMMASLSPSDVAFDSLGNLYISGNDRIRRIAVATNVIGTVAGGGVVLGDGGPATAAMLNGPSSLAFDSSGNLYIADARNTRIRKVTPLSGIITTVAGNDVGSFYGDGGIATSALLALPSTVAVDTSGNLYIGDTGNGRVRKVAAGTRIITTIAGGGTALGDGGPATAAVLYPFGIAVAESGDIYISSDYRVRRVDTVTGIISTVAGGGTELGDGGPATAASLAQPHGVALDAFGNLYIADYFNNRIRKVTATTGIISTVAGSGNKGFFGDGGPATAASLYMPTDVAVNKSGDLYVADNQNDRIRKITAATGIIRTIAGGGDARGDGVPATTFDLEAPAGVALDGAGNLYIANTYDDRIHKVAAATGIITTVAGGGSVPGDAGPATAAALSRPSGVVLDSAGNLYIADWAANRIRVVFACVSLDAPKLSSPAEGSTGVSTSLRLAWNSVRGAFRYDVVLDIVSPPKKVVASDIATTTFSPSNLEPLTTYYWQVVAKGDPFCVPFSTNVSEVRSFTTAGACTAPGPFGAVSPAGR